MLKVAVRNAEENNRATVFGYHSVLQSLSMIVNIQQLQGQKEMSSTGKAFLKEQIGFIGMVLILRYLLNLL